MTFPSKYKAIESEEQIDKLDFRISPAFNRNLVNFG